MTEQPTKKRRSKKSKQDMSQGLDSNADLSPAPNLDLGLATSLEGAAEEWAPDTSSAKPAAIGTQEFKSSVVTLVMDPFGINTPDVALAQELSEHGEIDLGDQDLLTESDSLSEDDAPIGEFQAAPLDEAALDSLSGAMKREHERLTEELSALTPEGAEDAAERLAREIAEDEELAKKLQDEETAAAALDLETADLAEGEATSPADLSDEEIQASIEALLFIADRPMRLERLRELICSEEKMPRFQAAIEALQARYSEPAHGIELVEVQNGLQFRTKPSRASVTRKIGRVVTQRLSSGAMECLAIVAYKQPVLKEDIDQVRGVDSSHFIRGLLEKRLIQITGRSELPGRPMLYETTEEFLQLFGLKNLDALPPLREIENMLPASQSQSGENEDPRVREMRKLVGEMKANSASILDYDPREDEKLLKEIRERVSGIAISTATLDAEREAKEAAKNPAPKEMPADLIEAAAALELVKAEEPETPLETMADILDEPPTIGMLEAEDAVAAEVAAANTEASDSQPLVTPGSPDPAQESETIVQ